jgi:hypothetical protein
MPQVRREVRQAALIQSEQRTIISRTGKVCEAQKSEDLSNQTGFGHEQVQMKMKKLGGMFQSPIVLPECYEKYHPMLCEESEPH